MIVSLLVPSKLYGIDFYTTRLLIYGVADGSFRPLPRYGGGLDGDNVIHIDADGKFFLITSQRYLDSTPAVWRVELDTLEMTEIVEAQRNVWSWYADPEGVVRAGVGIRGKRWWLLYRSSAADKFERVVKGRLSDDDDDEDEESDIDQLIPIAGSDKGYAIANKTTGRYAIYHYDFATDTIGEPLFEHPQVDVESFTYSPVTGDVQAITFTDDRSRIVWFDPEMKALQTRIDRTFPGMINRIISTDAEQKRMVVWVGGASDPGAYYFFDAEKRRMRELARPYSAMEGRTLSQVESVKYDARDGLSIPAYLTLPKGRDPAALPLIVMPHGGPFIRDTWSYNPWAQFLADRGYAVLQPNFRGSTGYGRAFVEAGEGQWGRKMQDDIDDGVKWLVQSGKVDPRRVCIMGASYGGYAAMWGAARNPEIYRCAISFAGISDVKAMLKYDSRIGVPRRYYRDWRDRVRGDAGFDLDAISPIEAANRIRVPLLIAHGKDDTNVPVSQSVKFHEALTRAGVPHEYVIYEGEGHDFEKVENSADFLRRVEAFLTKHNPAK